MVSTFNSISIIVLITSVIIFSSSILTVSIVLTINKLREISRSSMEQSTGISQVKNAIEELSNLTQQNAASSEELFASSTELMRQSSSLMGNVAFFKTSEDNPDKTNKTPLQTENEHLQTGQQATHSHDGFSINLNDIKDSDYQNF